MNKLKIISLSAAIASALVSSTVIAGASGNIGYTSDYYFRGLYQASSSASAGFDYEHDSGLFAGTWWGDVGEGLETDYYVGYSGEASGFSYGVSFIVYDYTDEFDDKYTEVDLTFGYGPVSIEYAVGEYDIAPVALDYTFSAITVEHNGFSLTFGSFGDDFTGSYAELAYGAEVGGLDLGISLLNNDKDLDVVTAAGDGETTLVFSLGKSFDL
ncbi:MAG: TorF family putative porin [Gammaproteobacteria bacterium]|nr:TorF family putative porin [Gammaproteobacteria bacterium]